MNYNGIIIKESLKNKDIFWKIRILEIPDYQLDLSYQRMEKVKC